MAGPLTKRPRADVRKVLVASAASPVNLGVLGAGILATAGLVVAGMPMIGVSILGLGTLAYGALVGLDLFSPRFIRKVYGLPEPGAKAPAALAFQVTPGDIEPTALRTLYQTILASHAQVQQAARSTSDLLQRSLTETMDRCTQLVHEAGRVARRGNALHGYLSRERTHAIEAEAARLEEQARSTRDQAASRTFRQAAAAKRQQLETYRQIEGLYDRIQAQLSIIQTSLEGVQAKIIKLDASDPEEAATIGASLSDHLGALETDIQVLESTVDETIKELSL